MSFDQEIPNGSGGVPGTVIPRFTAPTPSRRRTLDLDPDTPPATDSPSSTSPPAAAGEASLNDYEPGSPGPSTPSPETTVRARTDTSGTDRAPLDPKVTIGLMITAVGMAFAGASMLIRIRRGARLRQPTKGQLRDIATPLARIASRHFGAAVVNGDLADACEVAASLAKYAEDGPLIVAGPLVDAGVPANLQTEPEEYP